MTLLRWHSDCDTRAQRADVPFYEPFPGHYEIWIVRRPFYCDRGDWLIHIEQCGPGSLDGADGFPRYFFGSEPEVMAQMELWASRRAECAPSG